MRRYECVVILDPELPDDDIRTFTEKYGQLIKGSGGEVIKIEDWGAKKLAYLVRKKDKGRYILFDFVGMPALISELERQLKIADEVMKFLSVKLEDTVDLEAFKAAKEPPAEAVAEAPVAEAPVAEAAEPEAESAETAATEAPETEAAPPEAPQEQPAPEQTEEGSVNE
jgi:small subunit ribosomal protein S6